MHSEKSARVGSILVRLGLAVVVSVLSGDALSAGVNRWTSRGPDTGGGIIAVDPRDANHLYVGTQYDGAPVFESVDGGAHWVVRSDGIVLTIPSVTSSVRQLAIDRGRPDVLYVAMNDGALFKTLDGARTWSRITSPPGTFPSIDRMALDPSNGERIYLAANHDLWRSDDGGESWTPINNGIANPSSRTFTALGADPLHPGTVYAGTDQLYKTVNAGNAWFPADDGIDGRRVLDVAFGPPSIPATYAGTVDGIFRTSDGGATWLPRGLEGLGVTAVEIDAANPFILYAGTYAGVYKSINSGATWTELDTGGGSAVVQSLSLAQEDSRIIYAWLLSGLFRSSDAGASWVRVGGGLSRSPVQALALAAGDANDLFAGGSTVFRTLDGGRTWQDPGNAGLTSHINALARDPARSGTLYAGGEGVWVSTDAAGTWFPRGLEGQQISSLVLDPEHPNGLYAGTYSNAPYGGTGVEKTTDGGSTWHSINTGLPPNAFVAAFEFDPATSRTLYAAIYDYTDSSQSGASGVYKTANGGGSWSKTSLGLSAHSLAFEAGDPATLYAGTNFGVWQSRDGGATWTQYETGLGGRPVTELAVDPAHPGVVYAAAGGGVFRSVNGGKTWQPMTSGLDSYYVNALLVSPSGRDLYAAGPGVFAYTIAGPSATLPAVASLHGIPPTFFHSDVSVFNGSATREAEVLATYRCLGGACPPVERTFTVPPRQARTFDDIVASLFQQPESGGAVEFASAEEIVVTSRLFTPNRPAPTLGMFVPGLRGDEAYPRALLSSLSRTADTDTGSRTNIGVYNGNDSEQLVTFSFVGSDGAALGEVSRLVPARQAVQINDGQLPAASDAWSTFACFVEGDGEASLFAYAVVIDNRSQDAIFVPGRDAAAPFGDYLLFPAVSSLHGSGNSFFHSDVAVVNPTPSTVAVDATYRCALGVCQNVERSFTLAPGEIAAYDDIVAGLLESPETGGALELRTRGFGRIVSTSRLFTPAPTEPTTGMFVPGLDRFEATAAAVLTSLTHFADEAHGSRVNAGVYNDHFGSQTVAFRLYRGDGVLLGQTSRLVTEKSSVQINDLFATLGVAGDVPAAYCLVQGDDDGPLYAYAAVIDNQSQDPIFVPGRNDPNPPPIVPPPAPCRARSVRLRACPRRCSATRGSRGSPTRRPRSS